MLLFICPKIIFLLKNKDGFMSVKSVPYTLTLNWVTLLSKGCIGDVLGRAYFYHQWDFLLMSSVHGSQLLGS